MTATEAALAAGYASAKDLGETTRVLDNMCEKFNIQPMVIGTLRFYPKDKIQKHLSEFREIPEDMVAVAKWCEEVGIGRDRICKAIRNETYPGTFVYGLREGAKGRPGYHVYAAEAAAFIGLEEPEEVEWLTMEEASHLTGLSKSKLRKLCDRDEVSYQYVGKQCQIDSASLNAWLEDQPEEERVSATDAPEKVEATAPDMTSVLKYFEEMSKRQSDMHREVVEMCRKPSTVTGAINNLSTRLEAVEEVVKASIQAEARREHSITEILKNFVLKLDETSDEIGGVNDSLDALETKLGNLDMSQVKTLIGKVSLLIDSFEKFRSAAIVKMQADRGPYRDAEAQPEVSREGDGIAKG